MISSENIQSIVIVRIGGQETSYTVTMQNSMVCFVPVEPGNADYRQCQKWIQQGGVPTYEDQE